MRSVNRYSFINHKNTFLTSLQFTFIDFNCCCDHILIIPLFFPSSVQEDALSISLPKQRRRRRRKVEIEAERAAKRRNLMDMVAQLRESHQPESQSQAMDLTKVGSLELYELILNLELCITFYNCIVFF